MPSAPSETGRRTPVQNPESCRAAARRTGSTAIRRVKAIDAIAETKGGCQLAGSRISGNRHRRPPNQRLESCRESYYQRDQQRRSARAPVQGPSTIATRPGNAEVSDFGPPGLNQIPLLGSGPARVSGRPVGPRARASSHRRQTPSEHSPSDQTRGCMASVPVDQDLDRGLAARGRRCGRSPGAPPTTARTSPPGASCSSARVRVDRPAPVEVRGDPTKPAAKALASGSESSRPGDPANVLRISGRRRSRNRTESKKTGRTKAIRGRFPREEVSAPQQKRPILDPAPPTAERRIKNRVTSRAPRRPARPRPSAFLRPGDEGSPRSSTAEARPSSRRASGQLHPSGGGGAGVSDAPEAGRGRSPPAGRSSRLVH